MALSQSSDPPARDQIVPFGHVVDLLAPALGKEKSAEPISFAARDRGMDPDRMDLERTLEILMTLGSTAGVVGIAARFARTRLLSRRKKNSSGPHSRFDAATVPPEAPATSRRATTSAKIDSSEIVTLLAHTIGTEKSGQIVKTALEDLGAVEGGLEREQALALLDTLARAQGIVGIAASFARTRLILRFDQGWTE